jgi:hypothetical protein
MEKQKDSTFIDYIVETSDKLAKQAHNIYSQEVDSIINSKSTNINQIEMALDSILGFCYDSSMLKLFKRLCRYYYFIDKQAVEEYIIFYREMWDDNYND